MQLSEMNLKDSYTIAFLKEGQQELTKQKISECRKNWWYNQRSKTQTGLRLTDIGLKYIDDVQIKKYEIEFPDSVKINSQLLIWLDRFLDCPYYLGKKSIYVTKEKAALEMYLFSGDIQKFGYIKALSKKLNSK